MTSQRQTDANRRNALLSTGPRSEDGKRRSRGNAHRHGLTAETVILGVEDAAEYATFEAEILTEYDPQTVVERELTLRLASLLWRLRRASLIETGLLQIYCKPSCACSDRDLARMPHAQLFHNAIRLVSQHTSRRYNLSQNQNGGTESDRLDGDGGDRPAHDQNCANKKRITRAFLQLAELGSAPFERVGRYEAALWRQFVQTLFALDGAKRHRLVASRHRFTPYPPQW